MIPLALLLIGFSLFSAVLLVLTHFRAGQYQHQSLSRLMGVLLLMALCSLQLAHFNWLYLGHEWVSAMPYRVSLYLIAPAFYFFSQPLLHPQLAITLKPVLFWHLLPPLLAPLLPDIVALPLAFIVGAAYLTWLGKSLYRLKDERTVFRQEMMLLGCVFAIAVAISVMGLVQVALPDKLFYSVYSIAIGLAFFLVQITLHFRPELPTEVRETALATYESSTLLSVNCDDVLHRLKTLMQVEKVYIDADLSLPTLASRLDLRSHQLSELINTKLGKGFSRYLREQRVFAACALLCDEPTASVLSVGLSVGFTSQSNFYQAFREIEGTTPGKYRKLQIKP